MKNITKYLALTFFAVGIITLIYFLAKAAVDGYGISFNTPTDYTATGQFGDFIGGVVGTFFALTGTILIYLTFNSQTKENKRIAFEASFFEMLRLHRENVNELRYRKYKIDDHITYENRQVMRVIFQEFIECYREVKKFSNSKNVLDYITPKYHNKLKTTILKVNPQINAIEMARIDIAYSIMFYGLGIEGESILRKLFLKKYNTEYYYKLLFFLKLKPKQSNQNRFKNWVTAKELPLIELKILIDELYKNRKHPEQLIYTSPLADDFKENLEYEKYYGGQQFRLGHYFRHLYQSYMYLNSHSELSKVQKYSYGKMFRAQLSTYEQALLLVNSISCIGMKWELSPSNLGEDKSGVSLITTYNLVKNLPGDHLFGIKYKTYYKNVDYETDEQIF